MDSVKMIKEGEMKTRLMSLAVWLVMGAAASSAAAGALGQLRGVAPEGAAVSPEQVPEARGRSLPMAELYPLVPGTVLEYDYSIAMGRRIRGYRIRQSVVRETEIELGTGGARAFEIRSELIALAGREDESEANTLYAVAGGELVSLYAKTREGYRLELQYPRLPPSDDILELSLSANHSGKETFYADPVDVVVLGKAARCLRLRARSRDLRIVLAPGVGVLSIEGLVEGHHIGGRISMRLVSLRRTQ